MPIAELENGNYQKIAPAVLITGDTGVGKSTAVAEAFGDYKWLVTNSKQVAAIQSKVTMQAAQIKAGADIPDPAKWSGSVALFTPEFDDNMQLKKDSVLTPFVTWINRYVAAAKSGKLKYRGLVIDELNTILDWCFLDLGLKYGDKGRGKFDTVAHIKRIATRLTQLPAETGKGLVCISHWNEKKFDEDEDSPSRGQLKYPAGPAFPVGTMIRPFCREMDLVWRLVCRDSMGERNRSFITQPTEDSVMKTRRFGLPNEVPLDGWRAACRDVLGYDL